MAKSRSIGGIYASLSLRHASFKKGLTAARKSLNEFGGKAAKMAGAGIAVGGAAIAAGMAVGMKKTMEMAGTLDDASVNTGIAIADMMLLRKSYELGGVAAEGAAKDIAKMQKALIGAASGGKDPFATLGLSATELLNQNPAQQFSAIGDAIMRIGNPAERAAKAMEIFGKSGGSLINVFGQVDDATQFLGRMPALMQQFAGEMARADDLINELPAKGEQFFTGFTAGVIGELLPALEKMNSHDFTTLGQNLGNALGQGLKILTSGNVWEILNLQFEKWLTSFQSGPLNALSASINAWREGFEPSSPDGYSMSESYQKFLDAGIEANVEKLEKLDAKIAALSEGTAFTPGPVTPDKPQESLSDAIASAMRTATPSAPIAERDVNEYQRRGLSLDAVPTSNPKEDRQTALLSEMRDLLKRMANSPLTATF